MRSTLSLACMLLLFAPAGRSLPLASPQGAALAVEVRIRKYGRPEMAYFVKLGEGDDPYRTGWIMPSNLKKGHYFYLLNAPPGRYTAVATFNETMGHFTMFGDSIRRATEVTVQVGAIAFIGELVLDQSPGLDPTDSISTYLVDFIALDHTLTRTSDTLLTDEYRSGEELLDYIYRGALLEVHRDPTTESRFLAAARVDLANAGWIPAIDRRIAELTRR